MYVRLALLGVSSRKRALVQLWLSVGLSLAFLSFGLYRDSLFWTIVFATSTLLTFYWYWTTIGWVDRNARWEK